ncbi:MAG TPA: TIGR03000 domain-containing protein [Gemmataceae bacterium]|nr:TIGR03000 domain-containing protein [Gemmataceae bacterium]
MTRFVRPLIIALLGGFALIFVAAPAQAQYRGFRGRVMRRPVYPPNRMPGWDWWRIYPWSPYNYGNNPYNPIVYPPYVAPYPVPYGVPVQPPEQEPLYGAIDSPQQVLVPHPSGGVTTPPPDAAVVRLYIPDRFGEVSFDDVKTSSIGTTRYYVTPDLPGDKPLTYDVKATFRRGGDTVTVERTVRVSPGKTAVIDFTRPDTTGKR